MINIEASIGTHFLIKDGIRIGIVYPEIKTIYIGWNIAKEHFKEFYNLCNDIRECGDPSSNSSVFKGFSLLIKGQGF